MRVDVEAYGSLRFDVQAAVLRFAQHLMRGPVHLLEQRAIGGRVAELRRVPHAPLFQQNEEVEPARG